MSPQLVRDPSIATGGDLSAAGRLRMRAFARADHGTGTAIRAKFFTRPELFPEAFESKLCVAET
jgi:hypothetical protein